MVFLNAHGAMVPWWPQPAHVKDSLAATTSSYLLYKSDCEAKTNGSNGQWSILVYPHIRLCSLCSKQFFLGLIRFQQIRSVENHGKNENRTTMFPGLSATTKADLFPPTRRSPRSLDSQPHFETDQKSWILGKQYIYPHWIPKNIMTHIQKKT